MSQLKDLTRQRFGKLTALYPLDERKNRSVVWHCKCDCGNEIDVSSKSLCGGGTKSCGCLVKKDLTGQRFGRLTAIRPTNKRTRDGKIIWECKCDCGNMAYIASASLNSGNSTSCGCYNRERSLKANQKDIAGQRFGKLTALYSTQKRSGGGIVWVCQCDCGNRTSVGTGYLISGSTASCGCVKSRGEELIIKLLLSLKIDFETQYSFSGCYNPKTGSLLKFDFYLPDYNCCIEYDGEQHFGYTNSGWNTKENFENTQYRDSLKDQYCKEHNIPLIRIPYTDFNRLDEDYILSRLKEVTEVDDS